MHFNIPHGGGKTVKIDPKIQKYGTFVGSRGIRITSNNDISVIFTNTYDTDNTIDSCNIILVANIARNYTISSYSSIYGSVLLVAGVTNDTNVTIFNGTDVLYSAIINLFDVLQYRSCVTSCDVTGIRVIADKPVSVSSGSTYAALLTNSGARGDYIVSEMHPLKTWSRTYIVSPVLPKTAFVSRILVENSFSSVTVSNISESYRLTPSSSSQYFETEALVLTSDHPFSLTQYGVSYDSDDNSGNPFMTVVPGVDQYINNYIFTVPHGYYGNLKQYVSLIVPKMYKDSLVLDGMSLHVYNQTNRAKILDDPAPFDTYTILTFRVNEGYHHFYHSSEKVTFGVFVYGHGYFLSYGFFAGYDLNGDCRIQTSTSTTTSISTSTMTSSTTSSTSLLQPRGQMCYNCEEFSHVDLCDTVKQCSKQEVCFTERYEDSGQTKFKTGCPLQNVRISLLHRVKL
ncbi:uncharacterized protein LOC128548860 [Mercenaria mercenaria]|uniref:uncharacterized protein LOC128548860 n=1 Tax=Mercenaria mercenaria TaxID=6596 RepID=UPI00234F72AC|nr:uncharacterized protein LOC128548860 [Mercenaria mercenaria]